MNEYNYGTDIFDMEKSTEPTPTPTPITVPMPNKRIGFLGKLLLTMLAIAVGGTFLGIGIGTGYVAMQHFMPEVHIETPAQSPGFSSISLEPAMITIDPQTPDFTDVIAQVKDSVVSVNVTALVSRGFLPDAEQPGAGSGFIFAQNDEYVFIATNNHVVASATTITISLDDNEMVAATKIGADKESDLAVLAVSREALADKGVPYIVAALGCSDSMRMGDSVVAIGNAMGAGQTATKGIVSAVNLQITVQDPNTRTSLTLDVLQTDAAVNQGNSGGPLINQNGEVIGIVTAKLFGQGIEGMGYVLPINNISHILEELKVEGSVRHPWVGVESQEISEAVRHLFNLPATGVIITSVVPDGPAYHAGIMARDLIVSFGEHPVTSMAEFRDAIAANRPGDEITVGFYRNGEYMELVLVLGGITR